MPPRGAVKRWLVGRDNPHGLDRVDLVLELGGRRQVGDGARTELLGIEAVADPEMRVDVGPIRRVALELLAKLADEDVDRTVSVNHRVAPDLLVDVLAL